MLGSTLRAAGQDLVIWPPGRPGAAWARLLPVPLSGDRTVRNGSAHWAGSDARAPGCTALPGAMGEDRHRQRPSWSRHGFGGGSHGRHRGVAHTCQATGRPARTADGPRRSPATALLATVTEGLVRIECCCTVIIHPCRTLRI